MREVTYEWDVPLPSDERSLIQLVVKTDGEVTASERVVIHRARPDEAPPRPRLYVLSAGIDDYADQRGMIFGLERFRRFFVPHWKRLFGRIRKSGVYSVMHVCGCATPAVPDLIDCGLDCLESLQPEAMDVYAFKREYGRDIRLWGGLGAQSTLPFGSAQDVRDETRRLKRELGRGGSAHGDQ